MAFDLTHLGEAAQWLGGAAVVRPFLEKILGPAATEVGGLLADPISGWRKELDRRRQSRFLRIASGAAEQVRQSGEEPVKIPDYIAVPLLDRATLVDDESLLEKWAALLANASRPSTAASISHLFPVMLSNLSPREAKFVDVIFNHALKVSGSTRPIHVETMVYRSRMNEKELIDVVGASDFRWQGNDEKAATLDNLVSLGIMRRDHEIPDESYFALAHKLQRALGLKPGRKLPTDLEVHVKDFHQLTIAGIGLVIACRPLEQQGS